MATGFKAGSAYVDLTIDLSSLVSGLNQAQQMTASSVGKIQAQLTATTPAASQLSNVITGMFQGAGMAAFRVGLQGIEAGFGAAESAVIGFNSRLEQSSIGWQTLLKNTGLSARGMLGDIQQIANATNFRFEGLETNSKQLLAMGIAAKQVLPTMIDIGNVASGLGLGAAGVDTITRALGQMNTATKVHAQDMMQLTSAGVPAWDLLAKATGKTTAEVQKLSEAGEISSDVFITAFRAWSRANFGDAMAAQSHTFLGAMSTIMDVAQSAGATIFKPLFDGISHVAQVIAQIAQTDAFQQWVARMTVMVGNAVTQIGAYGTVIAGIFGIKIPTLVTGTTSVLDKYTKSAIDMGSATRTQTVSVKDLNKELKDAKEAYKVFADAQVTGTKAYSEALFALEQQQAQAQLNKLDFEQPGAGLDQILKPIQEQIDASSASVDEWKQQA
jgi:tape measure domain-containing protein